METLYLVIRDESMSAHTDYDGNTSIDTFDIFYHFYGLFKCKEAAEAFIKNHPHKKYLKTQSITSDLTVE